MISPVAATSDPPRTRRGGSLFLGLYRLFGRGRDKAFSLLCARGFAAYGTRSVIQPPTRISGERRIAIGNDVFIGSGSWLQVLEGDGSERHVAIHVGDGTSMAGGCVLSASRSIRLGRQVLMARNVYIADHMHAFEKIGDPVIEQGIGRVGPVEIGDGAWLGQNVVVGPSVRIGRGAVIGANSVVLQDVPDYTVAVGAPARHVRSLVKQAARASS
jgi:lipopolysaccharide O-acetyltransferase